MIIFEIIVIQNFNRDFGFKNNSCFLAIKIFSGNFRRFVKIWQALTAAEKECFAFIRRMYPVPIDFELRAEYGPLSGMSFEKRLIAAYENDKLEPTGHGKDGSAKFCARCGGRGHLRFECTANVPSALACRVIN